MHDNKKITVADLKKSFETKLSTDSMNELRGLREESVIGNQTVSNIRDCLIYDLAMNDIRRSLEFTKLTLKEFRDGFIRQSKTG